MMEKWPVAIPQSTGKRKKRSVYVYLPDALAEEPEQRFPVLYMFDGHNVFYDEDATYGKSWGMERYLVENRVPLMVVAVECSHAPNNGRLSEYSPFTFCDPQLGRIYGRGKITMDWFVNTLKPMIDQEYPTLPGRETTFIAGSSMGGLMSLYALAAYNHVFSRAAALSPSIWVASRRLEKLMLESDMGPDTVLYMDYGAREMAHHPGIGPAFARLTERLMNRGVLLTSRIVPNGDHCEACWEEQLPLMMNTLLYQRD